MLETRDRMAPNLTLSMGYKFLKCGMNLKLAKWHEILY